MSTTDFDTASFLEHPSWDQAENIRKAAWLKIAEHYCISLPTCPSKVTRATVKNLVLSHFICQRLIKGRGEYVPVAADYELNLEMAPKSDPLSSLLDLEKYKLELQHKQVMKMRKQELEMRKLQTEREIKLKETEQSWKHKDKEWAVHEKKVSINLASISSIIPAFDEGDIDGSFKLFDKIATKREWPEKEWMTIVGPKLSGESLRVYSSLDKPEDYEFAKKQILHAHAITPEGYRQKFTYSTEAKHRTFVEFATDKMRQFKK